MELDTDDTLENIPLVISDISDLEEDPDYDLFLPFDWVPMHLAHICAKTAATMKFISDAKLFLEESPNHVMATHLKKYVRQLREMEIELTEWTSVEAFIESLQADTVTLSNDDLLF